MDWKQFAALAEGRFEVASTRCELRQREASGPSVPSGAAFLGKATTVSLCCVGQAALNGAFSKP